MKKQFIVCCLFFTFCFCFINVESFSCKNNNGDLTDWFVIFKTPGTGYYYYDATLAIQNADLEYFADITAANTALMRTSAQYYETEANKNVLSVLYNDKLPVGAKAKKKKGDSAHMKGAFIMERKGFLLQHTIPGFFMPNNIYPTTGIPNGQHVLCISLDRKGGKEISKMLYHTSPQLHHLNVPFPFKSNFWNKILVANFQKTKFMENFIFETPGEQLIHITGTSHAQEEPDSPIGSVLWDNVVAFHSENEFPLVTWSIRGPHCRNRNEDHKIKDVLEIDLKVPIGAFNGWTNGNDHSKYGYEKESKVFCFGDLNHTETKKHRGGAVYCLKNSDALIAAYERTFTLRT